MVVGLGRVSGLPEPLSDASVSTHPEMSAGSEEVLASSIQSVPSQLISLRRTSALAAGAATPAPANNSSRVTPQVEAALTDPVWPVLTPGCTGENPD